eukprot:2409749-Prorocentrum_lima.AAC.1
MPTRPMDTPTHDDERPKKKRKRGKRAGTGNRDRPSRQAFRLLRFGYYVTRPPSLYEAVEQRMAAEAAAAA